MTWNAFHRRGEILAAVAETADRRLDGILPTDVDGVTATFADDVDLIGALTLKWHARLSGQIERALTHEPMDLPAAVASAWRRTAELMPGVRLVIDTATDSPASDQMADAMGRAQRAERARLAQAAGLATDAGAAAVAAGARIEEKAREGLSSPQSRSEPVEPQRAPLSDRESFVRRIKAVLAA